MKKTISILIVLIFIVTIIGGCAGTNRREQGAMTGAGLGAIIGALASNSHSWWGAAIGATAGLVVGMLVGDAMDRQEQENAKVRAAQTNQTVVVYDQNNNASKSEPIGQTTVSQTNNMRTECQKVKTTVWKDGKQVSEEINEVCTSTKTSPTY